MSSGMCTDVYVGTVCDRMVCRMLNGFGGTVIELYVRSRSRSRSVPLESREGVVRSGSGSGSLVPVPVPFPLFRTGTRNTENNMQTKPCGTPNCTLFDFHEGLCSHLSAAGPRHRRAPASQRGFEMDPSKFFEHEAIEPERPNQHSTSSLCEPTRTSAIADEDGASQRGPRGGQSPALSVVPVPAEAAASFTHTRSALL